MALTETLIFITIGLSASILFLKDRTSAVLAYGAVSITAVVLFSMYAAPDVALAEASIGLVFTLFLYMVTLQHRGKLWLGLVEIDKGLDDLEIEIIRRYCESHELRLEIVKFNEGEILKMLESGKIEVAAAALLNTMKNENIRMTEGFLETKVFNFGNETQSGFKTTRELEKAIEEFHENEDKGLSIDLVRYMSLPFSNEEMPPLHSEVKGVFYSFGVVADEEELFDSLNEYLKELKESGELNTMIERHVR